MVSGTCQGYAKPSWQALKGIASDGLRDLPDLFAANGAWGHYYIYCDEDIGDGGAKCLGAPSDWSGAGGTSFATPILAAIQALVNQKTGEAQGDPNPTYYALANTEYGTAGKGSCNSTRGNQVSSSCIFYDVTLGDIDVNCTGTHNCYDSSGNYGGLSTLVHTAKPAYTTALGYDSATGIGTLNAYDLVFGW